LTLAHRGGKLTGVKALDRLVCLVRRHSWEQHTDPAGTLTFCARCGKLRHVPGAGGPDAFTYQGSAGDAGPPGGGD
jgi:hypothetical protein